MTCENCEKRRKYLTDLARASWRRLIDGVAPKAEQQTDKSSRKTDRLSKSAKSPDTSVTESDAT